MTNHTTATQSILIAHEIRNNLRSLLQAIEETPITTEPRTIGVIRNPNPEPSGYTPVTTETPITPECTHMYTGSPWERYACLRECQGNGVHREYKFENTVIYALTRNHDEPRQGDWSTHGE